MRRGTPLALLAFVCALSDARPDDAPRWKAALEAANRATLARQQGEIAKATRLLEDALAPCDDDDRCRAMARLALGVDAQAAGRQRDALAHFEKARDAARAAGERAWEAAALTNLGDVHTALERPEAALRSYEEALPIWRELGDRTTEARCLGCIGMAHSALGEKRKALDAYEQALPIFRALPDPGGEATTLTNIGSALHALGDTRQAIDAYEQALPLFRAARDPKGEAIALTNIGVSRVALGERRKALGSFERSLAVSRAARDRRGEAATLSEIGAIYAALGEKREALRVYEQALQLLQAVHDRIGEGTALNNIGVLYDDLGEPRRALEMHERALPIRRAAGDRTGEPFTLANLGRVHGELGDRRKALEYSEQALSRFQAVGDRNGEAAALWQLGDLHLAFGDWPKALEDLGRALPIARATGDRSREAVILRELMLLYANDSPAVAAFFGKQAVAVYQTLREDVTGLPRELQRSYALSVGGAYRLLADLLASQGRLSEAQEVLALLKEQEADELLRGETPRSEVTLRPEERSAAEQDARDSARLVMAGAERAALLRKASLTSEEKARLAAVEGVIESGLAEFQVFLATLAARLERTPAGAARAFELRETEALMSTLGRLGPGTVAVYTVVVGKRLRTILVTSQVERTYPPVEVGALGRQVLAFRVALRDRADPRRPAKVLYDALVRPLEKDLEAAGATTIMWWLDGALRYLPVAALYDGKQWLVERYRTPVFTLGSLARLERTPRADWRALGLGVTRAHDVPGPREGSPPEHLRALPGVKAELEGIVRQSEAEPGLLPGVRRLDEEFTRDVLRGAASGRYPLIHVASHFSLRPGDETSSYLLLGDGTPLPLRELQQLAHLDDVDLLTLSACDTAVGGSEDGREVDAVAIIAQRKGAAAVLASLWPVADASTSAFMTGFYRRREDGRTTKAEALRQTQLAFLRGEIKPSAGSGPRGVEEVGAGPKKRADWTHPYYWAPFVLIGNWR